MPSNRYDIASVFWDIDSSLHTAAKLAPQPTQQVFAHTYLRASTAMRLRFLTPEVDATLDDLKVAAFRDRAHHLRTLATENRWQDLLKESHALLADLPGDPIFDPIRVPLPPPTERK